MITIYHYSASTYVSSLVSADAQYICEISDFPYAICLSADSRQCRERDFLYLKHSPQTPSLKRILLFQCLYVRYIDCTDIYSWL